ncbi:hypothetical protein ADIS_0766 [Lunatimonas lonarensis]|uniref:DUF6438 domain-containing protein n=1 Tax=Lunatimonas lonarensis TaxID=1232681 RepID=R7ZXZ3_9BACT|nr:DUF6438 domain-containing protein [Lunatimonas lonarensis]EON78869.1 hypothetical protein ADIS_0766 [Lunatimonas lonarensis]
MPNIHFFLFLLCSPKEELGSPISIEGDWIEVREDTEWIYDWSGLKFENDTAYIISDFGLLVKGPYSIIDNRIITKEFDGIFELSVQNLTEDSLEIEINGDVRQYYSRRLEYDKDLKFNSISISSYKCMDLCWEFDYRLDSSGFEVFEGKYNTQTIGLKKSKLNEKLLNKVDSLFKWSNIEQLDPEWVPIAVDGWFLKIDVNFNENESISFSTTSFEIPYRLKPIFNLIINHLEEKGLK